MPSILIKEIDATTGGGRNTNFNVVYIPGFMSNDVSTDAGKATGAWPIGKSGSVDYTTAAPANTPILCESIKDFEKYFGTKPATFEDDSGDTTVDKSYIYAKELLKLGLPVLYESMNGINTSGTIDAPDKSKLVLTGDNNIFEKLTDRGEYQFKYLTSGGYGNYTPGSSDGGYAKMRDVAVARGDCLVLVDYITSTTELTTLYETVKSDFSSLDGADQCALFAPWVNIDCSTYDPGRDSDGKKISNTIIMPPSFAYLSALGNSIRTNASWLAVAGATRGQIPNLNGKTPLSVSVSNSAAESVQNRDNISINAITNIKPFGHRIWGNRTLKNNSTEGNLTATSFLNIRNMVCDVKKIVYEACRKYTFEQNNDVLWLNFKSYVEPTLNQMKTGAGLSGYKIIKEETDEKAKLVATIKLYPLYAVEDFDITVKMLDDEIAVS